tara:strand:+ start:82 stop:279 length:198 start_codon:yes stop_codon:yes gene_type:complete
MKIHEIIQETASVGGMSAGAVATVVKPIANDVQRVVQKPKKPKKTKHAHKKPGPKKKLKSSMIRR